MHRHQVVAVLLLAVFAVAGLDGRQAATGQKPKTAAAQRIDRSGPPQSAEPRGEFTVRRLDEQPPIDGRTWIATSQVSAAGTLAAPNGEFTLTLEEASSDDVVRFRIYFNQGSQTRIQLDAGRAVYAFVTPDSRWIVSDPLEVIDVTNWRRYSLSTAFDIDSYVGLRAISSDGRRLFISRQSCPFDCRNVPDEYYEIGLPARTGAF